MKLFCLAILFAASSPAVIAQRLHLNLFAGVANYQGDMNEKFSLSQSHGAFSLGLGYEISDRIIVRGAATFAKIGADDKNGMFAYRNLNFTSGITEGHIALEYYIRDPFVHQVVPYVFAGVAAFHYNPYTFDSTNKKVFLQPLGTEGQGFVAGRNVYKLTDLSIPFGGGFKINVNDNLRLGLELGFRKTSTDYLDDLSNSYVDESVLRANRGPKAVELAYREDELKAQGYPSAGTPRGGPKYKDWYYFSGITASFRLGNGGGGRSGGRGGVGCPSAVY